MCRLRNPTMICLVALAWLATPSHDWKSPERAYRQAGLLWVLLASIYGLTSESIEFRSQCRILNFEINYLLILFG